MISNPWSNYLLFTARVRKQETKYCLVTINLPQTCKIQENLSLNCFNASFSAFSKYVLKNGVIFRADEL